MAKTALGLYTIYDALRRDWRAALERVARTGCDGVEFYGDPPCDPEELRENLAERGLALCGWHVEWRYFTPENLPVTLDYHLRAGTPTLVIPALGGPWEIGHTAAEESRAVWLRHARELNRVYASVNAAGMRLGYHTHAHEFSLRYDGERVWDLLRRELHPEILLELDIGNCIEGGGCPQEELDVRSRLLHCKPFSHQNGTAQRFAAPGDETDWAEIQKRGLANGVEWFLFESEAEGAGRLADFQAFLRFFQEVPPAHYRKES